MSDKMKWPNYDRINIIGQNGNDGEHYAELSNLEMAQDLALDEKSHEEFCLDMMAEQGNNYDIYIEGKYNTGSCVIDCYRLFAALEAQGRRLPAELEHSIKKILFCGQRGAKDAKKDLLEAINQIHFYLEREK